MLFLLRSNVMKKFKINISRDNISTTIKKIQEYDWKKIPNNDGWELGTNKKVLKKICTYWTSKYNWEERQKKLNSFNQYTAKINDINIHFIYEKSQSKNALPLLISHGWPGSIFEFKKIIGPLVNPKKYGLDNTICFDVIAPSIPGFGFSGSSVNPIGPRKIATYFNKLMVNILGYKKYYAQGGDWGGAISSWLAADHDKYCRGIHLNIMIMRDKNGVKTVKEQLWKKNFIKNQIIEEGYRSLQSTKPNTLYFAMANNPVGIASWIIEKFHGWSDLKKNDLFSVYTMDEIIDNIMLYILTNKFLSASWIYYGRRIEGGRVLNHNGKKINVPTACAIFPKEFLSWPPKSYVSRLYNLVQWNKFSSGGHFAAMEQPEFLVKDIRKFIKKIK